MGPRADAAGAATESLRVVGSAQGRRIDHGFTDPEYLVYL